MNRKSKPIKIIWKLYFRILVNPMLLVDNPTMTEYLCKNERNGPQTIPKENKSKSFYNSKLLKNVFFLSKQDHKYFIFFSDGRSPSWSSMEFSARMMDYMNARLATKADNSSNLVTYRYAHLVETHDFDIFFVPWNS